MYILDYLMYNHTKCFLVTWAYIVTEFVGLNNSPSCQKCYCESVSLQYMDSKLCGMEFPMYYSSPTDETWVTCTQLPIIRTHIYTYIHYCYCTHLYTSSPVWIAHRSFDHRDHRRWGWRTGQAWTDVVHRSWTSPWETMERIWCYVIIVHWHNSEIIKELQQHVTLP